MCHHENTRLLCIKLYKQSFPLSAAVHLTLLRLYLTLMSSEANRNMKTENVRSSLVDNSIDYSISFAMLHLVTEMTFIRDVSPHSIH